MQGGRRACYLFRHFFSIFHHVGKEGTITTLFANLWQFHYYKWHIGLDNLKKPFWMRLPPDSIQSGFLLGFNFLEGSIPVKQNLIFLFAEVNFFSSVYVFSFPPSLKAFWTPETLNFPVREDVRANINVSLERHLWPFVLQWQMPGLDSWGFVGSLQWSVDSIWPGMFTHGSTALVPHYFSKIGNWGKKVKVCEKQFLSVQVLFLLSLANWLRPIPWALASSEKMD